MVIWRKLNRGAKIGLLSGVAASIVGAACMGLAVGAMLGGGFGEKLDGANGVAVGGFLGFILVAGIIIVLSACVGAAAGHALHRFDMGRRLKLGGRLGGVLGVLAVTPLSIYLGSAAWTAVDGNLGKSLVGALVTSIFLLLPFTLAMDAILVVGFGVGAAIGQVIYRFFDPNPHESVA